MFLEIHSNAFARSWIFLSLWFLVRYLRIHRVLQETLMECVFSMLWESSSCC